jgi:hypothetical protein
VDDVEGATTDWAAFHAALLQVCMYVYLLYIYVY